MADTPHGDSERQHGQAAALAQELAAQQARERHERDRKAELERNRKECFDPRYQYTE